MLWCILIPLELIISACMVMYNVVISWLRFFYAPRKSLAGETILLTGAAGGIGSLLSTKLSHKQCTLVLLDVSEHVQSLAESVGGNGSTVHAFQCDITDSKEMERVGNDIIRQVGHPTVIINNAGTVAGKYFHDLANDEILKTFEVNTFSHYSIIKKFLPHMLDCNHGHVVSISSILSILSVCWYYGLRGLESSCHRLHALTEARVAFAW